MLSARRHFAIIKLFIETTPPEAQLSTYSENYSAELSLPRERLTSGGNSQSQVYNMTQNIERRRACKLQKCYSVLTIKYASYLGGLYD